MRVLCRWSCTLAMRLRMACDTMTILSQMTTRQETHGVRNGHALCSSCYMSFRRLEGLLVVQLIYFSAGSRR